jgi:hypothetical protein
VTGGACGVAATADAVGLATEAGDGTPTEEPVDPRDARSVARVDSAALLSPLCDRVDSLSCPMDSGRTFGVGSVVLDGMEPASFSGAETWLSATDIFVCGCYWSVVCRVDFF